MLDESIYFLVSIAIVKTYKLNTVGTMRDAAMQGLNELQRWF